MLFALLSLMSFSFDLCRESPEVRSCLEYLSGPRSRDVNVGLQRSVVYVAELRSIFKHEGVPEDLIWLALIESAFDPLATSPTGAQGMFQFKKNTARAFGLVVRHDRDDRNNPLLAARACARYLSYLKERFTSWELVLAAYNLGEGDLRRAMATASAHTWEAVRSSVRLETRVFVPKVKAAAILGNNYLTTPGAKRRMKCATYSVRKGDTLYAISKSVGLDVEVLKELNDLTHHTIYVGQILIVEADHE